MLTLTWRDATRPGWTLVETVPAHAVTLWDVQEQCLALALTCEIS